MMLFPLQVCSQSAEERGCARITCPLFLPADACLFQRGANQTIEQNGGTLRLHAIPPLLSNCINLPGKLGTYLYEKQLQLL